MSNSVLLKSLHKNINVAVSNGILDFLEEYQTQKLKGYFSKDKMLFKIDAVYSLKEINKDYSFLNQRLSPDLIPIAKSESGDRLAIHFKTGQIYLWELEKDLLSDKPAQKEIKMASSWHEFKNNVKSFYPETPAGAEPDPKPSFFEKLFRAG